MYNYTVPSSSPSNVSATAVSSTVISVMWQEVAAIDQNGNITVYEVTYNGEFDVMNQSNFTDGNTQVLNITGLDEFADYTISVRAYTSMGPGPYSPIALVTTDEDSKFENGLWLNCTDAPHIKSRLWSCKQLFSVMNIILSMACTL